MKHRTWMCLAAAVLLCAPLPCGCDKADSPRGRGGAGSQVRQVPRERAAGMDEGAGEGAVASRDSVSTSHRSLPSDASAGRDGPPGKDSGFEHGSKSQGLESSGPTGLIECDKALELVCRCAAKEPSLGRPCRTLGEDAPGWKLRAREAAPGQLEDLRKACQRIVAGVGEAYGCK